MRYGIEILGDVGIDYLRFAFQEINIYIFHRLMGTPLRSESVRVVLKVSFEDRLDYYLHCHLHYPVPDHRYSQRSFAACCLRNVNPANSLRLVVFPLKCTSDLFKILFGSSFSLLDAIEGFTIYSRCSLARFDKPVGVVQDVQPVYLVIEKIESVLFLLLGLRYSFL